MSSSRSQLQRSKWSLKTAAIVSIAVSVLLVHFYLGARLVDEGMVRTKKLDELEQMSLLPSKPDGGTSSPVRSQNVAVYILGGSGFGSQIMNLLHCQMAMDKLLDRRMVIDESFYSYRRSAKEGVLTGFFTPAMPVLDRVENRMPFAKKWLPPINHSDPFLPVTEAGVIIEESPNSRYDFLRNDNPVTYTSLQSHDYFYRRLFMLTFKEPNSEIYRLLMPYACSSMKFNNRTMVEISMRRERGGLPTDWKSDGHQSVAFHIRRSDKIASRESRKYTAYEYVSKMIDMVGGLETVKKNITRCFVMSDHYEAIDELREEFAKWNITCPLYTLTTKEDLGTSISAQLRIGYHDTLKFLAQLSVLMESTYFIGTMNSNIGSFTALMRSCPAYDKGYMISDAAKDLKANHYFNSFGVDGDWSFV